jgi:hypothetical protein
VARKATTIPSSDYAPCGAAPSLRWLRSSPGPPAAASLPRRSTSTRRSAVSLPPEAPTPSP